MNGPPDLESGLGLPHQHFLEIDWRELEPYFTELQECASFWILINLVGDMVYSTLIIFTLFFKANLDSPFFQGMHSHINPVLMYLIISLVVNYGALRANQGCYEKCFLALSLIKTLLFVLTLYPFLYLILSDVQDYFGDFWTSFVVILGCYNATSALSLWSMYIYNKFIYIHDSAQLKQRMVNMSIFASENHHDTSACNCDDCGAERAFAKGDTFLVEKPSNLSLDLPPPIWTVYKPPGDISSSREAWERNFDDFDWIDWGSVDDISNLKISL